MSQFEFWTDGLSHSSRASYMLSAKHGGGMAKRKRIDDEQRTFELLVQSELINGKPFREAALKAGSDLQGVMARKRGQESA